MQLELQGVPEAQIRRIGRWTDDSMSKAYLSNFPLIALRVAAGFKTTDPYSIPRTLVTPEASLLATIFPFADDILSREKAKARPDFSTLYFAELLVWLRTVIVQDAAALLVINPNFPLPTHSVFSSPAFAQFVSRMRECLAKSQQAEPDPMEIIVPAISSKFDIVQTTINQGFADVGHRITSLENSMIAATEDRRVLQQQVGSIQRGYVTGLRAIGECIRNVRVHAVVEFPDVNIPLGCSILKFLFGMFNSFFLILESDCPIETGSEFAEPMEEDYRPRNELQVAEQSAVLMPVSNSVPTPQENQDGPTFIMETGIKTVTGAWQEWFEGFPGKASVKSMDHLHKKSWRKETCQRQHYSRRRRFIEAIEELSIRKNVSCPRVVAALDRFITSNGKSVSWLERKWKEKEDLIVSALTLH